MIDTLLLTYTEAAHRLGLRSGRSVRRLVAQGNLTPVYPLPRSPRIPLQDLQRYIDGLMEKAHHSTGAGSAVLARGGYRTCRSANKIVTVSQREATRHTGGRVISMQAEQENLVGGSP